MDYMQILGFIASVILASATGLAYMGISRRITARIQNRVGPPIYQNVIDIMKLFSKETQITHGVMQHLGPVFAITASITSLMFIPILRDNHFFVNLNMNGDMVFLLYIMVFGSLGMALGAGQTGNPNSAIAISRGLSQMVGYEVPFVLAMVALMMNYHTTNLHDIMMAQHSLSTWGMIDQPLAFLAAILAFLGMMSYAPFDVVSAPSELASGPVSEFGGKYLGTMMTSRSIFAFAKLVLFVDLFMGGADNILMLVIKTFLLYMIPLLIGIVNPRFRTEQSIRFFMKYPLVFGIIAVLVAAYRY